MTVINEPLVMPQVDVIPGEKINEELLRKTLEHIQNNPQTWKQDVWFTWLDPTTGRRSPHMVTLDFEEVNSCGSAFCFAGHAALKSGFVKPPENSYSPWDANVLDTDGRVRWFDASEWARRNLGLTEDQADVLFAAENTMTDLENLVNAIIENPSIGENELLALTERGVEDDEYETEEYDDGSCDEDCEICYP